MMSKAELKKPFCVQSGLEQEEETVLTSHVTNDIHSNRLSQKGTFFLYHESVKIAIKIIFLWKKSLEFLLLSKVLHFQKSYLMLINNHRKNIHKWEFFNQSRGVIFFFEVGVLEQPDFWVSCFYFLASSCGKWCHHLSLGCGYLSMSCGHDPSGKKPQKKAAESFRQNTKSILLLSNVFFTQ